MPNVVKNFSNFSTSLPGDHALISAFASSRGQDLDSDLDDEYSPSAQEDSSDETIHVHYNRPRNPRIATLPVIINRTRSWTSSNLLYPSESTGLLNHSIQTIRGWNDPDEPHHSIFSNGRDDYPPRATLYWEECKTLLRYTTPVFMTHALEYSLVIASVVSIGHISTTALAASTLGSMTASVTGYSIVQGFASALDTMLPSAWTSSQPQHVGLWSQRMMVVIAALLVPILGLWINAERMLPFLRQDSEVAHLAATYLKWSALGLPADAFNAVSRRYFHSQGLFSVPTIIIISITPLNAILTYLLVWGPEPIRLGFIGAPIATAVSFNLIAILSFLYGAFFVPKTAWYPLSTRCFSNLGVLVQLGLAGVGQIASEWWSWELVGLAASMLGSVSLATQSVLLVSASATYQAPFALSVAASVRVGNLLGQGDATRARVSAQTSLLISFIFAAFSSGTLLAFRQNWGYLFNSDPQVVSLVAHILPLVALFQVFDCLDTCVGGILRARGKQFTGAVLNLSAYYILGIPMGSWFAFAKGMELTGLWLGLTIALVYCGSVGAWICLRTNWECEVEKVSMRLSESEDEWDNYSTSRA